MRIIIKRLAEDMDMKIKNKKKKLSYIILENFEITGIIKPSEKYINF